MVKLFDLPTSDANFKKHYGGSNPLRVIYDSRLINSHTTQSRFPLLEIRDIFQLIAMAQPQFITTVDLVSGYTHVGMTLRAKIIAPVVTQTAQYKPNKMCFGLKGAPATFVHEIGRAHV